MKKKFLHLFVFIVVFIIFGDVYAVERSAVCTYKYANGGNLIYKYNEKADGTAIVSQSVEGVDNKLCTHCYENTKLSAPAASTFITKDGLMKCPEKIYCKESITTVGIAGLTNHFHTCSSLYVEGPVYPLTTPKYTNNVKASTDNIKTCTFSQDGEDVSISVDKTTKKITNVYYSFLNTPKGKGVKLDYSKVDVNSLLTDCNKNKIYTVKNLDMSQQMQIVYKNVIISTSPSDMSTFPGVEQNSAVTDGNGSNADQLKEHNDNKSTGTLDKFVFDTNVDKIYKCNELLDQDLKDVIQLILKWIRILVPILLIILVAVDFAQCVISQDNDAIKKAISKAIKRGIAALGVFFIPLLVSIMIDWLDDPAVSPLVGSDYIKCQDVLD